MAGAWLTGATLLVVAGVGSCDSPRPLPPGPDAGGAPEVSAPPVDTYPADGPPGSDGPAPGDLVAGDAADDGPLPALDQSLPPAADGPAGRCDLGVGPEAAGADVAHDAPSCANTVQDGLESDIDCGGNCAPCLPFRRCSQPADCRGGLCDPDGLRCQPSCTDRLLDGGETDIDCGGPCPPCRPLRDCLGSADCTTGLCAFLDHGDHCFALPTCSNGQLDDSETDVDCGGDYCAPCSTRRRCLVDVDCYTSCAYTGYCR
jgi:hypothetical protein